MPGKRFLYDFGVSQDDPQSELMALDLKAKDSVLCIASAGEIPLELLLNAPKSVRIDAVDISKPQLFLSNLKLQSALRLEPLDAVRFLGFLPTDKESRNRCFKEIKSNLTDREITFWSAHPEIFDRGPIFLGRYETYINYFAPLGRWLLGGKKKICGLFSMSDVTEQKKYFEQELRSGLLKKLFRLMFSSKLYTNRGIAEQGLQHREKKDAGLQFYNQFKSFCTNTPARKNWILQFVLIGRVLFAEALPDYLSVQGMQKLSEEHHRLQFYHESYTDRLKRAPNKTYNKFALSNVTDWLSDAAFAELVKVMVQKSGSNASGLIRYIYTPGIIPDELKPHIILNDRLGKKLLKQDRFPFYKLMPFEVTPASYGFNSKNIEE